MRCDKSAAAFAIWPEILLRTYRSKKDPVRRCRSTRVQDKVDLVVRHSFCFFSDVAEATGIAAGGAVRLAPGDLCVEYAAAQTPSDIRIRVRIAKAETWCRMKYAESGLWLSGLLLIAIFFFGMYRRDLASQDSLREFAAEKQSVVPADQSLAGDHRPERVEMRQPEVSDLPQPEVDARAEKSNGAVAVLRIARIGMEVPVRDGTDKAVLAIGAGLVEGTTRPGARGNIAIAAHRDTFFRGLRDLDYGDLIELESFQHKVTYRVSALAVVDPDDVQVLAETGESALTLVTCYPFQYVGNAPQRYIVRAVPAKSIPPISRR